MDVARLDATVLHGIAAARGIAIGPAVVLDRREGVVPRRRLQPSDCEAEWQRFQAAVLDVQSVWRATLAKISGGRHEAAILEAYVLMAGDELLAREVRAHLVEQLRCAEWAVTLAARALAEQLEEVDDPYLRERSQDIEFVGRQLVRSLSGAFSRSAGEGDGQRDSLRIVDSSIVVARELSPADTAAMVAMPVLGFLTEVGSRTSHTAIMARSLGIPAVVGVGDAVARIAPGDFLIVDGTRGTITVGPSDEEVRDARRRAMRERAHGERLLEKRDVATTTADGMAISLAANVEIASEVGVARACGADGVGLFRTEFLFVDRRSPPTEDEQLDAFREAVVGMGGRCVTLRTFDLGGDKFSSSFDVPRELNPMLGLRAVRLQLRETEVLLAQLRAMLRASAYGPVRILVPLVSSLDELSRVRELVATAREQVAERGQAMAESVPLGVMIEVPAAAMMADFFAREADFMSVGTNDLVQYALAVDRSNRSLAHLATPLHPAVLRLLARVLASSVEASCPVSVCGEMASEPLGALLLVGLGMRELSMDSAAIAPIREALGRFALAELKEVARQALGARTAFDVQALLDNALGGRVRDLVGGLEQTFDDP